jgi:hypothetical protein
LACRHGVDDVRAGLFAAHLRPSGVRRPNGRRKLTPADLRNGSRQRAPESGILARVFRRFGRGTPDSVGSGVGRPTARVRAWDA